MAQSLVATPNLRLKVSHDQVVVMNQTIRSKVPPTGHLGRSLVPELTFVPFPPPEKSCRRGSRHGAPRSDPGRRHSTATPTRWPRCPRPSRRRRRRPGGRAARPQEVLPRPTSLRPRPRRPRPTHPTALRRPSSHRPRRRRPTARRCRPTSTTSPSRNRPRSPPRVRPWPRRRRRGPPRPGARRVIGGACGPPPPTRLAPNAKTTTSAPFSDGRHPIHAPPFPFFHTHTHI